MRKWLCILLLAVGCPALMYAGKPVIIKGATDITYVSYGKGASSFDMRRYGEEHENIFTIRYGGLWLQDQYLSSLLYSGQQVGFGNEWWQDFSNVPNKIRYTGNSIYNHRLLGSDLQRGNWKHVGRFRVNFGWSYNEAYTNIIYSLGMNGGWGACYSWKWRNPGIELLLGPYLELDWKSKLQGANVNKPYSTDIALNLCGLGSINWTFRVNEMSFRVRYLAQMNLIGAEYVPDYWQSYYEMGEGVFGKIKFSNIGNHWHLQHELTFDMQLKHSTWRVGVAHAYLEYGLEKMRFSNEEVSAIVGCIWNYRTHASKSVAVW